ncbi:MAG: hypothetical protein O2854_03710 [Chloroflexi bacterium]|nr:hypothetical protein [Chloroflexota bacterium]
MLQFIGNILRRLHGHQRGAMLVETVITVGILATVMTVSLQGIAAGSRGVNKVTELTTAHNVARSQFAHTMNEAYCAPPCSYPSVSAPPGYSVTSTAEIVPGATTTLSNIVIYVRRDGKLITSVERMRADR